MKRIMIIALVFGLCCTGCSWDKASQQEGADSVDQESAEMTEQNLRKEAYGRYVETDITPPGDSQLFNLWVTDSEIICEYTNGTCYSSINGGESWAELDTSWQEAIDGKYVTIQAVSRDGTIWALGTEGGPQASSQLWRVDVAGNIVPVPIGNDVVGDMHMVTPLNDNRLLIQYYSSNPDHGEGYLLRQNVFHSETGELLYEINPSFPESMGFCIQNEQNIFFMEAANANSTDLSASVIRIADGAIDDRYIGIIPGAFFQFGDALSMPCMEADQSNLYYISQSGLCRMGIGGTLSEIILDTGLYSFQDNGVAAVDLAVDDATFYIVSRSANSAPDRLLRYTFDPDIPFYEDKTPQGATYYLDRNVDEGDGVIRMSEPGAEAAIVVEDVNDIKAENDRVLVFTRNKIQLPQTQPVTETLHYYDKDTGAVQDIFVDSWAEYSDFHLEDGCLLGAYGADKDWYIEHPNYVLEDGTLQLYISRIQDNETDIYLYHFVTDTLLLSESINWDTDE